MCLLGIESHHCAHLLARGRSTEWVPPSQAASPIPVAFYDTASYPSPPGRELILGGIASSRSLHCHWPQGSGTGLVPAWVGLEAMGPSSSGLWGGPDLPQRGAKRLLLLPQGLAHHPAADRRPQRLRKVLLEVLRGRPSLVGKHRAPGLCGHPHSVRRVGHPRGGDGVQEPRECPPSRGRDERVSRGGGS